ncbi:hypothetical protein SGPA1_50288 [Streptomyces misionensis JCM 4497]
MRKVRKSPNPKVRGNGPEQGHEAVDRHRHRLSRPVHRARFRERLRRHRDRRAAYREPAYRDRLTDGPDDPGPTPLVLALLPGPAPHDETADPGRGPRKVPELPAPPPRRGPDAAGDPRDPEDPRDTADGTADSGPAALRTARLLTDPPSPAERSSLSPRHR